MSDLFYEHLVKCKECRETCLSTVSHHTYQKYLDSVDMSSYDMRNPDPEDVKQDDNLWREHMIIWKAQQRLYEELK